MKTCSICQKEFTEWGNNARPVNDGRCCDDCNATVVLPARIRMYAAHDAKKRDQENEK